MERSDYYYAGDTVIHYIITDGEVTVENDEISIGTHTRLIQNEDLMGTLKFKDKISDSDDLVWGAVFPRYVSFSVSTELETLKGIKLNIYDYFNDEPSTLKKRGSFIVTSDKRSDGRNYRDVEGYDDLITLQNAEMMNWYNALLPTASSATTLAQFRASFASYFGLTQASMSLANDSMPVVKTMEGNSGLSGGYVAKCIGEITGTFPRIGKEDGKLYWKELEDNSQTGLLPDDELYPDDTLYPDDPSGTEMQSKVYLSCYHEDFTSTQITRIQIRTNEEDIGITYGTEGNDYIIQSNFLLYGKTAAELQTVASNLLPKLTNRAYVPFTMLAKGNPELEAGDHIYFIVNNSYCRSYILSRELQGVSVLRDNYEARGLETREPVSNDVNEELVVTKARYMYLRKDLDGLSLIVGDNESGLVHQVNIDHQTLVSDILGNGENSLKSRISQTEASILQMVKSDDFEETIELLEGQIALKVASDDFEEAIDLLDGKIDLRVTSTDFEEAIGLLDGKIALKVSSSTYNSDMSILESEISSKVEEIGGNSSFSWRLLSNGFQLKSNNSVVFNCDSGGVNVYGSVVSDDGNGSKVILANGEIMITSGSNDSYVWSSLGIDNFECGDFLIYKSGNETYVDISATELENIFIGNNQAGVTAKNIVDMYSWYINVVDGEAVSY